eukprot:TRINITY_DN32134_c0_g1_i1.p3 TRINITY_DN32134_c0_g1~~TRINITY_DN32134_c0_g1_i1.p3  ORF type:complete len:215 (+),score=109.42 TRINITY_DN32134_c0_g1_i1:70-714(+)
MSKFSLDGLVQKMELAAASATGGQLPTTQFTGCMREVFTMFDGLGGGFGFAASDLEDKIKALDEYAKLHDTINKLLEADAKANNKPDDDEVYPKTLKKKDVKCSATRAINRCAFVCLFITKLFEELRKSRKTTMKAALATAYEPTMAKYHGFMVRGMVKASFGFCADRAEFLKGLNISEDAVSGDLGQRLMKSSSVVCDFTKQQFDANKMKWVF